MSLSIASAAALVLLPATGFSLGIRIVDQDSFATSRGEAVVATADNPSAIYYNPAGITQLDGTRAQYGVYGITLDASVNPALPGAKDLDKTVSYYAEGALVLPPNGPMVTSKEEIRKLLDLFSATTFAREQPAARGCVRRRRAR